MVFIIRHFTGMSHSVTQPNYVGLLYPLNTWASNMYCSPFFLKNIHGCAKWTSSFTKYATVLMSAQKLKHSSVDAPTFWLHIVPPGRSLDFFSADECTCTFQVGYFITIRALKLFDIRTCGQTDGTTLDASWYDKETGLKYNILETYTSEYVYMLFHDKVSNFSLPCIRHSISSSPKSNGEHKSIHVL